MQCMKTQILVLGLLALLGCMPNGFLASRNTASTEPAVADPKIQSNDRPTETGAGVPGYLVNCSDINAEGELVQVGCSVATLEGKRVPTAAESWNQYEVKLSADANPNIVVTKLPGGSEAWDVIFQFTGAPLAELRAAAKASSYGYSGRDEKGDAITATTPPVSTPKPPPPPSNQDCSEGVMVEGICIVTVSSSCTDYCAQAQMQVHPWVVDRYGTGAANGRQACIDLYKNFPDYLPIPILGANDVATGRGLGCHRAATGQTFFDSSPTDPSKEPFISYTRICACQ